LNIFSLRSQLISDYSKFIESYHRIQDDGIRDHVQAELRGGLLWPKPLIQLNPAFVSPIGVVEDVILVVWTRDYSDDEKSDSREEAYYAAQVGLRKSVAYDLRSNGSREKTSEFVLKEFRLPQDSD
jgi:hypothetical protein